MAKKVISGATLKSMADAIREKLGYGYIPLAPADFVTAIRDDIESVPTLDCYLSEGKIRGIQNATYFSVFVDGGYVMSCPVGADEEYIDLNTLADVDLGLSNGTYTIKLVFGASGYLDKETTAQVTVNNGDIDTGGGEESGGGDELSYAITFDNTGTVRVTISNYEDVTLNFCIVNIKHYEDGNVLYHTEGVRFNNGVAEISYTSLVGSENTVIAEAEFSYDTSDESHYTITLTSDPVHFPVVGERVYLTYHGEDDYAQPVDIPINNVPVSDVLYWGRRTIDDIVHGAAYYLEINGVRVANNLATSGIVFTSDEHSVIIYISDDGLIHGLDELNSTDTISIYRLSAVGGDQPSDEMTANIAFAETGIVTITLSNYEESLIRSGCSLYVYTTNGTCSTRDTVSFTNGVVTKDFSNLIGTNKTYYVTASFKYGDDDDYKTITLTSDLVNFPASGGEEPNPGGGEEPEEPTGDRIYATYEVDGPGDDGRDMEPVENDKVSAVNVYGNITFTVGKIYHLEVNGTYIGSTIVIDDNCNVLWQVDDVYVDKFGYIYGLDDDDVISIYAIDGEEPEVGDVDNSHLTFFYDDETAWLNDHECDGGALICLARHTCPVCGANLHWYTSFNNKHVICPGCYTGLILRGHDLVVK